MGRVIAPYGVKGWIKVQPFTQEQRGLLDYPAWRLGHDGAWQSWSVETAKVHADTVVAKLAGIVDREQAAALRGLQVAVSRGEFPQLQSGEFYWADLIGLVVVNAAGVTLGTVSRVLETGANDVLAVTGDRERLLPFVGPVIRQVDIDRGVIAVDWDADY